MRKCLKVRLYGLLLLGVMLITALLVSGCGKTGNLSRVGNPREEIKHEPADLSNVEKLYEEGKYESAIIALNTLADSEEDILNLDLLRWSAKLSLATKNYPSAYYYSGWINAADDSENKIWDAAGFLFSVNPDYTTSLLEALPTIKDQMDKHKYVTCFITGAYVRAVRRVARIRSAPTQADTDFLDGLADSVYALDTEIGKSKYDLGASLAEARFYHFMAITSELHVLETRAKLEKAIGMRMGDHAPGLETLRGLAKKLALSYYDMVWINLEKAMPHVSHYPDVLFIAGDALVNMGKANHDEAMIEKGLGYLESAYKQKPSEELKASIALGKAAIAMK